MPFNFYTRVKSDLSITIIVIQHSIFVCLFTFTKRFLTFLCCHVIWCHFISIGNTLFIFLVRWVSLGLGKHIYDSYFGFSVHINLITTSLGLISRNLTFLVCLEHLCLIFHFPWLWIGVSVFDKAAPSLSLHGLTSCRKGPPTISPVRYSGGLSILCLPRKKQAAVVFICLLGTESSRRAEHS